MTVMQHTITQQVSVHPLDMRLFKCDKRDATYQLEIYHTNESPDKNVGAIAKYNGKFSYSIGENVNVHSRIDVNLGCWLTNCIMNECLKNHIRGIR
ncbi:MAG: hypothetical protein J6W27_03975 [Alphaproteobacteria bacterium]|nr:hypothetical protein [Alphaproteobacteria bacterium]